MPCCGVEGRKQRVRAGSLLSSRVCPWDSTRAVRTGATAFTSPSRVLKLLGNTNLNCSDIYQFVQTGVLAKDVKI